MPFVFALSRLSISCCPPFEKPGNVSTAAAEHVTVGLLDTPAQCFYSFPRRGLVLSFHPFFSAVSHGFKREKLN